MIVIHSTPTDAVITSSGRESPGSLFDMSYLAVWSWVLGYTAVLASLSVLRHHLWLSTGYDLGLFEQGLWLLGHRGILAPSTYTGHPVLADGASYILLPLAPIYNSTGVGFLLVLQAFAFGVGYLWIRRIGRAFRINERDSHLLGLVYFIYPTVLGTNLFDFHPDALGVPLLLGMVWAAVERRWRSYAILALAALAVKDAVALLVTGMGIALLLQRRMVWGPITLAGGVTAGYMNAYVIIPALIWAAGISSTGAHAPSSATTFLSLLDYPQYKWGWVGSERAWEYLAWLFGPLLAIVTTLRTRALNSWWIPGLALVATNLLSHTPAATSPFNQMSVLVVPFFFVALLVGLRGGGTGAAGRGDAVRWLALPVLFLAAFAWQQFRTDWRVPLNADTLQAAVASVPAGVPVVAQNFVAAHLADRDYEWTPVSAGKITLPAGTYIILDRTAATDTTPPAVLSLLQESLAADTRAKTIFSQAGVTVHRLLQPLPRVLEGAGG